MRIHTSLTIQDLQSAVMRSRVLGPETAQNEHRARTAGQRTYITGVGINTLTEHGSRTHAHAFELQLSGDSTRGPNSGAYGMNTWDDKAATWDQWGLFLSALFDADPDARVGGAKNPIYINREHFHWTTGNRYAGTPDDNGVPRVDAPTGMFFHPGNGGYHRQHKWVWEGWSVTDAYSVSRCACGAIVRRMACDRSWSEISA